MLLDQPCQTTQRYRQFGTAPGNARTRAYLAVHLFIISTLVLTYLFSYPSIARADGEVAVLYFIDHSNFDSGGGCLSIWPFNFIFGSGKKRETWNLESGFRDILNEELKRAGYNVIPAEEVDKAMEAVGREDLPALAAKLGVDILITGEIKKFEQHRARASSQGPTVLNTGQNMKMTAMGGMGGFYYSATINTDIRIFDDMGDQLEETSVNTKKDLADFYMGVGPMTYHRGDRDQKKRANNPIVDYNKLDAMKFGSDEFKNRTLLGMATMDVIKQVIALVKEYVKPPNPVNVSGKIIYVGTGNRLKKNEVYIDLGVADGIKVGQVLGVYTESTPPVDSETGKKSSIPSTEKIGSIKVSKVETEHLSIAEIIEKKGEIQRDSIVK